MNKKGTYGAESKKLEIALTILSKESVDQHEIKEGFVELTNDYEDLLIQTKIITRISDRLQNKLDKLNLALQNKNEQLEDTIDELAKAKIGRKATTIVLFSAIILFILTEVLIEPLIEEWAISVFTLKHAFWVGLLLKLMILLFLKPGEMLLERSLVKQARQEMLMIKIKNRLEKNIKQTKSKKNQMRKNSPINNSLK